MFMDKYDIPKPTTDKGYYYSWCFATEKEKNSQIAPYVSVLNDPSVGMGWKNGKWGVSTFNMEKGGILRHVDFHGFYSTNKEIIQGIFGALERWAEMYWLKREI